jgi:hypothetical protein
MRRVVPLPFLLVAALLLALPAPAGAHSLSKARAKQVTHEWVREDLLSLPGQYTGWEYAGCNRKSRHAFKCYVWMWIDAGYNPYAGGTETFPCRYLLHVFYKGSHRARRRTAWYRPDWSSEHCRLDMRRYV